MEIMKAMPEFIQRNDREPMPWTVEEGAPVRGDAWTEMRAGRMRVPYGADELSRTVRAHELMHAKVSPHDWEKLAELRLNHDSLVSAEEFRVNMLIAHQGFNTDVLADGSESRTGKLLGETNNWNGVVRFMASCAGTKSGKDFLRGLNSTNPEFAKQARNLQKALVKMFRDDVKRRGVKSIADTRDDDGIPRGFRNFTVRVAELLDRLTKPENADGTPDEHNDDSVPDVSVVAKGRGGQFARLIEKEIAKPRAVDGKLGRKRIASQIGKNPRRMNRMLTDPDCRIFDRRAKGKGGIVLIDQSGSMRLDEREVWKIIEHAPGCVIIGYSHATGTNDHPNVWVIADRGKVADEIPAGPGGNGVDGPAIRFAQAKRKMGEPFIWVCDGYVTDGKDDNNYSNLNEECASLVVKYGIHMVRDVDEAVSALKVAANSFRLEPKAIGNISSTAIWSAYRASSGE